MVKKNIIHALFILIVGLNVQKRINGDIMQLQVLQTQLQRNKIICKSKIKKVLKNKYDDNYFNASAIFINEYF